MYIINDTFLISTSSSTLYDACSHEVVSKCGVRAQSITGGPPGYVQLARQPTITHTYTWRGVRPNHDALPKGVFVLLSNNVRVGR